MSNSEPNLKLILNPNLNPNPNPKPHSVPKPKPKPNPPRTDPPPVSLPQDLRTKTASHCLAPLKLMFGFG